MKAPTLLRLIWLLGGFALLLAAGRETALRTPQPVRLVTGTLVWLLDGAMRPTLLSAGFVIGGWIAIGIGVWRRHGVIESLSLNAWRALAVSALVAASGVAKAAYSGGPEGELFAGTHCRTLAVGDRSDARISFHIVQAAAHHLGPASADTERFFTPWTFFSRGPLAGLAALPVSLATAGMPPVENELRAWQPFDETGFAAYRIVLIALASTVIVALFAALVPPVGETWALVGAGLLALCPFGVHEILFTWPKWAATACLLASFGLAHQRRPFAAGLALGVGFLFHPMAALWAPWLIVWAAGRNGHSAGAFVGGASRYAAAMSLLVVPWLALGNLPPQLPGSGHAGPGSFLRYFVIAEYQPATWEMWWRTRWANFSNTFIPFWLHLFNRDHPVLGSVFAPSGPLVKFAFGWWNTLPLGAGLGLWTIASCKMLMAARSLAIPLLLFFIGPALLLTAYWGASSTGLMRECGHPVLVGLIALFCVACANSSGKIARLIAHPAIPWLQLPETFLMLWLTTLLNPRPPGADLNVLDPIYLALNFVTLGLAAWVLSYARRVTYNRIHAP